MSNAVAALLCDMPPGLVFDDSGMDIVVLRSFVFAFESEGFLGFSSFRREQGSP